MNIEYEHLGIELNSPLIVAVSGGPDSVCLLSLLHEAGFQRIVVVHLDHGIRADSHRDSKLAQDLADKYGYAYKLARYDIPILAEERKENLEAVGRFERYRFFRELRDQYQASYIVTAHHADDQIETVLMNIIRGCGLEGLRGMRELDADIWRPLLPYGKQEILRHCEEKQLPFINEPTNDDLQYRRNYLRHEVIPKLKELNPNLLGTMHNNIRLWRMVSDYFQDKANDYLKEQGLGSGRYEMSPFLDLKEVDQQVVLRRLFEEIHGHKHNLLQDHLEQVLKVLRSNVSGKKKEFGPGKMLVREREFFEIQDAK